MQHSLSLYHACHLDEDLGQCWHEGWRTAPLLTPFWRLWRRWRRFGAFLCIIDWASRIRRHWWGVGACHVNGRKVSVHPQMKNRTSRFIQNPNSSPVSTMLICPLDPKIEFTSKRILLKFFFCSLQSQSCLLRCLLSSSEQTAPFHLEIFIFKHKTPVSPPWNDNDFVNSREKSRVKSQAWFSLFTATLIRLLKELVVFALARAMQGSTRFLAQTSLSAKTCVTYYITRTKLQHTETIWLLLRQNFNVQINPMFPHLIRKWTFSSVPAPTDLGIADCIAVLFVPVDEKHNFVLSWLD